MVRAGPPSGPPPDPLFAPTKSAKEADEDFTRGPLRGPAGQSEGLEPGPAQVRPLRARR